MRIVVAVAEHRGHEVIPLSRSTGQDVSTGVGLDAALTGADAVIDVTSVASTSAAASVEFFGAATRHLLAAEERQSVGHHVALSIIAIDYLPLGYYAGKLEQERLVTAGPRLRRHSASGWPPSGRMRNVGDFRDSRHPPTGVTACLENLRRCVRRASAT